MNSEIHREKQVLITPETTVVERSEFVSAAGSQLVPEGYTTLLFSAEQQ